MLKVLYSTTKVTDGVNIPEMIEMAGAQAGICYSPPGISFEGSYIENAEKATKRFSTVMGTGHHSPADHTQVTVLFEGISKMTAMLLNSLGFYTTSEKSGRYTIMTAKGRNKELYEKWLKIFNDRIAEIDPDFPETTRNKIAQENARYMLSMFAPATTMGYTTSLRQWNYIIDWCERYMENPPVRSQFEKLLLEDIKKLHNDVKEVLYVPELREFKGRKFNFLASQVGYDIDQAKESYGDSYLIKYEGSFAMFAQTQRHRTLGYFMIYDGISESHYYIPVPIKGTKWEDEWLRDLKSISDTIPIATMVGIVETGLVSNYMLKLDERLCGRVQLELLKHEIATVQKFHDKGELSPFMEKELQRHYRNGKVILKCGNFKCKEPCYWGPIKSQEKLF